MTNQEVRTAMETHHAEMVQEVSRLSDAVWRNQDRWEPAHRRLLSYCTTTLLPHAAAEETTVYATSRARPQLEGLIQSMQYEHEVLKGLVTDFDRVKAWREAAELSSRIAEIFHVHAEKENRFVLAVLEVTPGIVLQEVLGALHGVLAGAEAR